MSILGSVPHFSQIFLWVSDALMLACVSDVLAMCLQILKTASFVSSSSFYLSPFCWKPPTPVRGTKVEDPVLTCALSVTTTRRPAPAHTSLDSLPTTGRASVSLQYTRQKRHTPNVAFRLYTLFTKCFYVVTLTKSEQ